MTSIFVSYRRADSDVIAGRIRDRLARAFGDDAVFMDIDDIPFGADFRTHVQTVLQSGDIMLAVIGPQWLARAETGENRLAEETDPVRLEIEGALKRKMRIIPVLVQGARMPRPDDLPASMRDFAFYNAAEVDAARDFHPHMDRLIRSIEQPLGGTRGARRMPRRWMLGAAVAAVALFAAAAVVLDRTRLLPLWPGHAAPPVPQPSPAPGQHPDAQPHAPASGATKLRWRASTAVSPADLVATFDAARKDGYRPKAISGFLVDGAPRYAVLWTSDERPHSSVGWERNAASAQRREEGLTKSGFRPVFISAYNGAFGPRFADIWERGTGPDWLIRRDLNAAELRAAIDENAKQGMHLVRLHGFAKGDASAFSAVFEKWPGRPPAVSLDVVVSDVQPDWNDRLKKGDRPVAISGYRLGQNDYITTLWGTGDDGGARFGLSADGYERTVKERAAKGQWLTYLSGYSGRGGARYNIIWSR